jgi:plastocyanin
MNRRDIMKKIGHSSNSERDNKIKRAAGGCLAMAAIAIGGLSLFLSSTNNGIPIIVSAQFVVPDEDSATTTSPPSRGEVNDTSLTNRTFYISTIRFDGTGNVTEEPFPNSTLPAGEGLALSPPDEEGDWSIRMYAFDPSQIVVYEGDQVTLNFVGVNAEVHNITVNRYAEPFELHRGELKTVAFTAVTAGTIDFICQIHQPTMHGQIIVLPRG